jgi:Tfp pilus assembly protein PilN
MIKINLLPQKRAKKKRGGAAAPSTGDTGTRDMALGIAGLAAAGVLVWLFFDKPKRDRIDDAKTSAKTLDGEIAEKSKTLAGNDRVPAYASLKAAGELADARAKEIDKLNAAKIVPAHVLHELGEILVLGKHPTMTAEMTARTGPNGEPNKQFQTDWDPLHVWLSNYTDSGGAFKIEGGAQTENDVAQLSKRLQASVYFMEVSPSVGQPVVDKDTGLTYYKFSISGKVAY